MRDKNAPMQRSPNNVFKKKYLYRVDKRCPSSMLLFLSHAYHFLQKFIFVSEVKGCPEPGVFTTLNERKFLTTWQGFCIQNLVENKILFLYYKKVGVLLRCTDSTICYKHIAVIAPSFHTVINKFNKHCLNIIYAENLN